LRKDGYEFAEATPTGQGTRSTGDLISVGLREGFEKYDFSIPFLLREREEELVQRELDVTTLPEFPMQVAHLKKQIGNGDVFRSTDLQTGTQFGDYRVDGGVMTATGYNEYLSRVACRISKSLSAPVTGSSKVFANIATFPFLQVNLPQLTRWVDDFIRRRLFGGNFNPNEDENWRLLLLQPVADHIIREFGRRLPELTEVETDTPPEVGHRNLSEVDKLMMREAYSVVVTKCIYERLPYPSRNGEFEKAFIEKAQGDGMVEAFCKLNEQKHSFLRLRYVKENGLPGYYHPDFLLRTADSVYLAETKAETMLALPDVQRKRRAAIAWCERINELPEAARNNRQWYYALIGEQLFYDFRSKGASLEEVLNFARLRPKAADHETLL
jgi:type III restriction enzyme